MANIQHIKTALVLKEDGKDFRILDAFGTGVVKYIASAGTPTDDTTGEPVQWTNTETGTNTWVNSLTAGSLWTITTGGTEYNGYSSQVKGEAFAMASGKPLYFGWKSSLSEATQKDFLVGLAETDTTLTAASAAHAIAVSGAGVFFSKLDNTTAIVANVYSGGALVSSITLADVMDTDSHFYEFYFDGTNLSFYFDGDLVGTITESIPTVAMTPSFSFRAGSGAAGTCEVGLCKSIQINS